jgi:hypothetical protein
MTRPIDGLIVAGTTGEGLTLDDAAMPQTDRSRKGRHMLYRLS